MFLRSIRSVFPDEEDPEDALPSLEDIDEYLNLTWKVGKCTFTISNTIATCTLPRVISPAVLRYLLLGLSGICSCERIQVSVLSSE